MFTRSNKAIILLILVGASAWIMVPKARSDILTSEYSDDSLSVVRDGALLSYNYPVVEKTSTSVEIRKFKVTAYSSSPDETDDTPDITALGTKTRKGVIASNFLPFGTKIKMPELFGDTVFTVEDRMNRRFQDRLDVWFPTKEEAKRFGLQFTEVEIEI